MARNIPSEREAMLTAETTAVINESYHPPEGKPKPSDKAVREVAEMLAVYCTAFKRMPNEFKLFDEAEQERIMENNREESYQWPYPFIEPDSGWDDRWEVFLQRLYLEHLRHDNFNHDWVQHNFVDLYHLTLHPVRFDQSLLRVNFSCIVLRLTRSRRKPLRKALPTLST